MRSSDGSRRDQHALRLDRRTAAARTRTVTHARSRRPLPRAPEDAPAPAPRRRHRARRALGILLVVALLGAGGVVVARRLDGPHLSPLRARIVSIAESQVGYRTDPTDSYCNEFSAYWQTGTATACGSDLRSEEWCADFAAWVWQQAGAVVVYHFGTDDLNSASYSFYAWGVAHGTWHALGSGYVPQPGDVAIYGLDLATQTALHVAIVTGYSPGNRGPTVVNGDGDRTGFSVVEDGTHQYKADVHHAGGTLSGYVAPSAPGARTDHEPAGSTNAPDSAASTSRTAQAARPSTTSATGTGTPAPGTAPPTATG